MRHIYLAVLVATVHCFTGAFQQKPESLIGSADGASSKVQLSSGQLGNAELPRYARPVAECSSYKKRLQAAPQVVQKSSGGLVSANDQAKSVSVSLQDSHLIPAYARAFARTQAYRNRQSMLGRTAVSNEQKQASLPESDRSNTKVAAVGNSENSGPLLAADRSIEQAQRTEASRRIESSREGGFIEPKFETNFDLDEEYL